MQKSGYPTLSIWPMWKSTNDQLTNFPSPSPHLFYSQPRAINFLEIYMYSKIRSNQHFKSLSSICEVIERDLIEHDPNFVLHIFGYDELRQSMAFDEQMFAEIQNIPKGSAVTIFDFFGDRFMALLSLEERHRLELDAILFGDRFPGTIRFNSVNDAHQAEFLIM